MPAWNPSPSTPLINHMAALISAVEALQAEKRQSLQAQVLDLLESFPRLHREHLTASPPCFNLLDLCGVGTDERRHTAILAWLLDENASHAQGTRFFKAFAALCGLEPVFPSADYAVRAEFPGFESITDIILFRAGDFFISIENKLLAAEGDDQLNREHRDLGRYAHSLGVPKSRRIAVFLTPQGREPQTGNPRQWCRLSYTRLAAAFRTAAAQSTSHKLTCFVADWLSSLENLTLAPYVDQGNQAPH
jgi:PD-(D/E)XK nuclease superfamily